MSSNFTAVIIGDINNDIILNINQHPIEGDESIVTNSSIRVGGSACNTALLLARLGVNTVFFGNVGNDPMGHMAIDSISRSGMDYSRINTIEGQPTGFITITVTPGGQRTMYSFRGCNILPYKVEEVSSELKNAQFLHISGYALLEDRQFNSLMEIIHSAKKQPVTISFDPGLQALMTVPHRFFEIIGEIDVLIISEREVQVLFPETQSLRSIRSLQDMGVKIIALKRGQKGSTCFDASGQHFAPVFGIDKVLDTTGAGDAFNSGFIFGFIHNLPYTDCLLLGNITAHLVITTEGGIPSFINSDLRAKILEKVNYFSSGIEEKSFIRILSVI